MEKKFHLGQMQYICMGVGRCQCLSGPPIGDSVSRFKALYRYPKSNFTLKEIWICAINYSALDFKGSAPLRLMLCTKRTCACVRVHLLAAGGKEAGMQL